MPLTGTYHPSPEAWVADQVALYERTNGAEGDTMADRPVIILATKGARSGQIRKTPLMRVEHDGSYALVASKGGDPKHPVWYFNLRADPHIELQDGASRQDMTVREVTGDEKAQWWARAVAAYPPYDDYQAKTDRQIPLFVATPAGG